MTLVRDSAVTVRDPLPGAVDSGSYLYGITRGEVEAIAAAEGDECEPMQVLKCGDLAAIVRSVPLAEFSPEALQTRLADAGWVEAAVHRHNRVIAAIHQQQAILPAKFGCVYLRAEDLQVALERDHDALLTQLVRLEGCDEWAVHVYVDRAAIEHDITMYDPTVQQLQQQLVSAPRGRAYFLQQQLAAALASAIERALSDVAAAGYDRIVQQAAAGQVQSAVYAFGNAQGEIEVLRAAFLVRRESTGMFTAEVAAFADSQDGVRCESTGPWPPYSFATLTEEKLA